MYRSPQFWTMVRYAVSIGALLALMLAGGAPSDFPHG